MFFGRRRLLRCEGCNAVCAAGDCVGPSCAADAFCSDSADTGLDAEGNVVGLPVASHPRLRTDVDGNLWAAALVANGPGQGQVGFSRYIPAGDVWQGPANAGEVDLTTPVNPLIPMAGGVELRTGPQFSFDVGYNEEGAKELRFVFTLRNPEDGRLYIQGPDARD